ncbi:ABC-2 type transporter [Paludibacter propionicigenes WB4]|uniref:Transport permease protein n=1 Tax=Paludibacter propionicigenes (strain DSM 17365 / JCM 13257 / WB4) TaxID=694427 RepID=E4T7Z9_PALPW|nr:ABC transporter permease [Paludibacter propionicigenes]ADQ80843.1 ABC-2 type transporter [Paludibacter propionicigenes WB4]
MKQLLSFIRKEFYHILRDKTTIMILLLMPIIQIILFGFALTTEVKDTQVAVLAPTNDEASSRIIDKLNASAYFDVVARIHNTDEIQPVFRDAKAKLVVVFEDHFGDKLRHNGTAHIQLLADATDPNAATSFTFYASNIINSYQQELMGETKNPYQITPEVKMLFNPQMKSSFNFVPGVLGMIMLLICAMMTSIAIVREKEMGTMEILLVSPMKPIYIILSKITPYFVLSCVNFATIMLLSVFVLGVPIAGSFMSLVAVSLLYIFVSLSFGLLVSTITNSQQAAMLVSGMGLMIPVMLLSGMMFPIENMPLPLQWFSNIVPAKWYIRAVKAIMIEGLGITSVLKEVGVLCLMGIVLVTISLKKFKVRLE